MYQLESLLFLFHAVVTKIQQLLKIRPFVENQVVVNQKGNTKSGLLSSWDNTFSSFWSLAYLKRSELLIPGGSRFHESKPTQIYILYIYIYIREGVAANQNIFGTSHQPNEKHRRNTKCKRHHCTAEANHSHFWLEGDDGMCHPVERNCGHTTSCR